MILCKFQGSQPPKQSPCQMDFLFTCGVMLVLENKCHVSALGCYHSELGSLLAVSQPGSGEMDRCP